MPEKKRPPHSCYLLVLFLSHPCFLGTSAALSILYLANFPGVTRVTKDLLYVCSGEGRADKDILS